MKPTPDSVSSLDFTFDDLYAYRAARRAATRAKRKASKLESKLTNAKLHPSYIPVEAVDYMSTPGFMAIRDPATGKPIILQADDPKPPNATGSQTALELADDDANVETRIAEARAERTPAPDAPDPMVCPLAEELGLGEASGVEWLASLPGSVALGITAAEIDRVATRIAEMRAERMPTAIEPAEVARRANAVMAEQERANVRWERRASSKPQKAPKPKNIGEAVKLHLQSLKKASADPRANMALPMGLKATAEVAEPKPPAKWLLIDHLDGSTPTMIPFDPDDAAPTPSEPPKPMLSSEPSNHVTPADLTNGFLDYKTAPVITVSNGGSVSIRPSPWNDPEVMAITKTMSAFEDLDADQRRRVLAYLNDRFGQTAGA